MSNDSAIMEAAWAAFIEWAWARPDFHAAYAEASGNIRPRPAQTPLDALIDQACGVNPDAYMRGFVDWATEHHWGVDYAPAKWRSEHAPNQGGERE